MKILPLVERVKQIPVREARYVPTICDGNVPLQGEDQQLFVDLTKARGGNRIAEIETRIRWAPIGTYEKHLVTGHSGSGKSTELHGLASELQKSKDNRVFHVVEFDIQQRLDPSDIQLPELVTALFSALWSDEILNVPAMSAAKLLGKDFIAWGKAIGLDLASDLSKGIPVLGTLLKNADLQERFREKLWKYTARVIEQMGDLIQEIRNELVKRQEIEDLVIIIDNLEKMLCRDVGGRTNYELLFIEQLPKLESLPVHMVLTFPVSLHADQAQLRAAYANAVTIQIPMVRVRARGSHADDPVGIRTLREFLARRLDLDAIFATQSACDDAIRASGGCVRDLLRIVSSAVVEKGSIPIDAKDIVHAVAREVGQFERVLQGRPVLPHLHTVEKTGSLPAEIDAAVRKWLLQDLIVIEYNGEVWYDVHPLARATRAYRESAPTAGPAASTT
jgi:energy-coupling factor transporter ATP-binding protein EcfA2